MSGASPERGITAYVGRALRLRCPKCGESPLFRSWRESGGIIRWFEPLAGCPVCDYRYEREPGYFLMAIWAIDYGIVCVFGLLLLLLAIVLWDPGTVALTLIVIPPLPVLSVLLIRHSKALFLALDRFIDPEGGPRLSERVEGPDAEDPPAPPSTS